MERRERGLGFSFEECYYFEEEEVEEVVSEVRGKLEESGFFYFIEERFKEGGRCLLRRELMRI